MIALSDGLKHDRLQLLADALSGGTLTLYDDPQPATGAAITTQTALISYALPASLTAIDNLLTILLDAEVVIAEGETTWGRMTDSTDAFVLDGNCGLTASSALFRLKTTYLALGATLTPTVTFAEA